MGRQAIEYDIDVSRPCRRCGCPNAHEVRFWEITCTRVNGPESLPICDVNAALSSRCPVPDPPMSRQTDTIIKTECLHANRSDGV
jgi:hypothetical protein